MHRINTSTAAQDMHGQGKNGFRDGNPQQGVRPTQFNASWANTVQEEAAHLIEYAGLELDEADNQQLRKAIMRLTEQSSVAYVDSVAALRNRPGAFDGQNMQTVSYYQGLAIGGAMYQWAELNVEADNGIDIIKVNDIQTGRWKLQSDVTCENAGMRPNDVTVDNTAVLLRLLELAKLRGNLKVMVLGKYWFLTGNIDINLNQASISFVGIDKKLSVFVYKKEDQTNTVYVTDVKANAIAKIRNINRIHFIDVGVTAETSYDNPNNGIKNVDAVYWGAVWGFVLDSFDELMLNRCEVTKFNYRGFSCICNNAYGRSQNGRVLTYDSNFSHNKASGLWVTYTQLLAVSGGECIGNGQLGQTGTGYGVTASLAVNRAIVTGTRFERNYRKGFDTHGCHDVQIRGCTFKDNVQYHHALLQWGSVATNSLFVDNENIVIDGNVYQKGVTAEDRAWLDAAYTAIVANGFKPKCNDINIDAVSSSGTTFSNTLKKVVFSNNKVLSLYNGGNILQGKVEDQTPIRFACKFSQIEMKNNTLNFNNFNASVGSSMYTASLIFVTASSFTWDNNKLDAAAANMTFGNYSGAMILLQDEQALDLKILGGEINLPKSWPVAAYSGAGAIYSAIHKIGQTGKFITKGLVCNIAELPTSDVVSYAYWGRIFDKTYPHHYQVDNQIRIGTKMLPVLKEKTNFTENKQVHRSGYAPGSIAAGTEIMEIIIDKTVPWVIDIDYQPMNEVNKFSLLVDGFPGSIVKVDSATFGFSRAIQFTDTNGQVKYKIYVKTLAAVSVPYYLFGNVRISGAQGSYGIYEVNYLV